MVSNLMYKKTDPNRKGRGAGYYYHRGNGIWSKYNAKLDGKEWHRRKKVSNKKKALHDAPHKADYKTKSKTSRSKVQGPPLKGASRQRGYF